MSEEPPAAAPPPASEPEPAPAPAAAARPRGERVRVIVRHRATQLVAVGLLGLLLGGGLVALLDRDGGPGPRGHDRAHSRMHDRGHDDGRFHH